MNFITYCRVSTDKQGVTGLGMGAQDDAVQRYVKSVSGVILAQYVEAETGKGASPDRPQLRAALAHCKATGATLLIAKLDRLARNVYFISSLMESGVDFIAADMPTANRLTIHILAAVAEHEAEMISQRTKAALAQAKARGVKLGGYRGRSVTETDRQASLQRRKERAIVRNATLQPIIEVIKQSGTTSLCGIATALNKGGIKAPRGGKWNAMQVSRVANINQ